MYILALFRLIQTWALQNKNHSHNIGLGLSLLLYLLQRIKAYTHTSTFARSALELVLELADSWAESVDSRTDSLKVGCPYEKCFIFQNCLESAHSVAVNASAS